MRRIGKYFLFLPWALCVWAQAPSGFEGAKSASAALSADGKFKQAAATLSAALENPALSDAQRKDLAWQIDLLRRIRRDYSLTHDELWQKLARSVRDLSPGEFENWIAEGRFDKMSIDGVDYFVGVSVRNLFFRYPELSSRRLGGPDTLAQQKNRLQVARAILKAARASGSPYVLPHQFRCAMTVTADPDITPAGATIRAWLPVPRDSPFQKGFSTVSSSSPILKIAPADSAIRSVYLEQTALGGQPTSFQVTYDYTAWGVSFALDPAKVQPTSRNDPALKEFTRKAPHVVFSPSIQKLADTLAGGSTNPMIAAKAFYDWIGTHIKYSFAREYSTLTNISASCLEHRYGDCGQIALLFITLCRYEGIPARWESGWDTFPGAQDIHDWTEIYLAPYGWVPVDPWAGVFAEQQCPALTASERHELHDFYFGGIDFYRMAANSDHSQPLDPPKNSFRSDDVDFQRGELESGHDNIYFDKYSYRMSVEDLPENR